MKFLSKLKDIFLKGLQIFTGFAPIIQQAAPQTGAVIQTVSQDLTEIAAVITDIEQASAAASLPGTQKLTMAAPLVADVILRSTLLANHKIANPDLFNKAATEIAGGMADLLNSLSTDGIDHLIVNKAA